MVKVPPMGSWSDLVSYLSWATLGYVVTKIVRSLVVDVFSGFRDLVVSA